MKKIFALLVFGLGLMFQLAAQDAPRRKRSTQSQIRKSYFQLNPRN
ncbi:MAG: hypothetical protein IPP93_15230 [Chitinophagaceae bacterium]|nr:hypothetical protein [Chitinophagaceae bacterium]